MAIMRMDDTTFYEYVHSKYKGKVHRIERVRGHAFSGIEVRVIFHIPDDEADELEVFRRINKVIEVIAEGNDESTNKNI